MATHSQRVEFITLFREQFPHRTREECVRAAGRLLRLSATHHRLAVKECNGPPDHVRGSYWYPAEPDAVDVWRAALDRRITRLEERITALCRDFAPQIAFVELGGDPRGYTVKLHFASKLYNTMGGRESGYGVPQ